MDFHFESDSLVLTGGVDAREYFFPVADLKTIYDYELLAIIDDPKSTPRQPLRHWIVPIKVYLDPKLDSSLKKDFAAFVSIFPAVENLSIEVVTKRENANYMISYTDENLKPQPSDSTYLGITYSLMTDLSYKIYGGSLIINPKQIPDIKEQIRKLRIFFFNSLGQFCILPSRENILFSSKYSPVPFFSEKDATLLRFHYNFINRHPVTSTTFEELFRAYRKLNDLPDGGKVKITLP